MTDLERRAKGDATESRAPCALVTGGSRGIGRAVVEALAGEGWGVALTYRQDSAAAERVVEALTETGAPTARAFQLDLADRARPKSLVEEVERALGPILGLVNNAGIQHGQLLAMISDQAWDEVIDINLGGTFRLCRTVVPGMVRRRRGAIVNLSSLGAIRGVAGQSAYAASKAGILALTRSLAREMGKRNLRVNAVIPGYVETDMTRDLPAAAVEALRAQEVLGSGTSAGDVAQTVAFLLSDRARAITGQALTVDSGASI